MLWPSQHSQEAKVKINSKVYAAAAGTLLAAGIGGIAVAQTPPAPPAPPVGAAPATPGQPQAVMLLTPVAIGKLQAADVVAVKGSVAEIYGNKIILQDDSGRMLVELGPQGEDGNVVTRGEQVAVQGRFDRGFISAEVVSHADGRNQAFGPPRPPRPDREADRSPGRRPPPPR
jgi:uncharacterized protein YdeI (BOF family)